MTYIKRKNLKPLLSRGEFVTTQEMDKILEELDKQMNSYDTIINGISENLKFIALCTYGASTEDADIKPKIRKKIDDLWGKLPDKFDYNSTGSK